MAHAEAARAIFHRLGDRRAEAMALRALGRAAAGLRRCDRALECPRRREAGSSTLEVRPEMQTDLRRARPLAAVSTALAFRGVTKRFRNGRVALREATWSVEAGSRTCLLGPNGAGKSTSIRILEGALRPTAGSAAGRAVFRADFPDHA